MVENDPKYYDSSLTDAILYPYRMAGSTALVAEYIASFLGRLTPGSRVLDLACGTGQVTQKLLEGGGINLSFDSSLESRNERRVHIDAVDVSSGMISVVSEMVDKNGWTGMVRAGVMDAMDLEFEEGTFDVVVANFGVSVWSDPVKGVKEMWRTLKPGGTAIVTCWKESGVLDVFWRAQEVVKPLRETRWFGSIQDWMDRRKLERVLCEGGFGGDIKGPVRGASRVKIGERETWFRGKDIRDLSERLALYLKELIGDQWLEEEKSLLVDVVENLFLDHSELYYQIGENVGVKMVAYAAVARK